MKDRYQYRHFTPEASIQKNASRIDELVAALGTVLKFAAETASDLGIAEQLAGSKLRVLHALLEDATRSVEAHAFGDRPAATFTQRVTEALASRQTEAAGYPPA
jgi:hypothetical protein